MLCRRPHGYICLAYLYHEIGFAYWRKFDYDNALSYYNSVLDLNGSDLNEISSTQMNIGVISRNRGDYKNALEIFIRTLRTYEDLGAKIGIIFSLMQLEAFWDITSFFSLNKFLLSEWPTIQN